jgi:phosphoglycolate phosphatase-like HAD superfamily hydrolase
MEPSLRRKKMLIYNDNDIRGVIFDLDGTLIDSLSSYYIYFNNGLEGIGLQPVSKGILFKFLWDVISLSGILRTIIPDDSEEIVV